MSAWNDYVFSGLFVEQTNVIKNLRSIYVNCSKLEIINAFKPEREGTMSKIKNCLVCGKEFESSYGREICSDECKKVRKKEQDNKGNYRRKTGISGVPEMIVCARCGQRFEGLNRRYCPSCSDAARIQSQRAFYKEWYAQKKESKQRRI